TGESLADSLYSLYTRALKKRDKDLAQQKEVADHHETLVSLPDGWFNTVFGDAAFNDEVDGHAISLEKRIHLFRGGIDNIGWPSQKGAEAENMGESIFITQMTYAVDRKSTRL